MRAVLLFFLALVVAPAIVQAESTPLEAVNLEGLAKQIEADLIAPCCWSQQVSEHQSPIATEMRADIRRRLAGGQTRDQILDAYVAEHGARILAVPPAKGFNYLLFAVPPFLFVATAGFVIFFVRRAARGGQMAPAPQPAATETDQYARQLDDELRDLD